jgi:hypothetical protein
MEPVSQRTEYRAHPAYVLASDSGPVPTPEEYLGPRWLKLSRAERRRRERVFFALLLERLGAEPGATLAATFQDLTEAEAFADRWRLTRDGYDVRGASRSDLAAALADETLDSARIRAGDRFPLFTFEDGWNGVRIWLDDYDKPTWSEWYRDLEAAIRLPDGEVAAGPEHPVRAWLFVVVSHLAWIINSLLAVGGMWLLDKNGVPRVLAAVIGVVLLVVLTLGPASSIQTRVERWLL